MDGRLAMTKAHVAYGQVSYKKKKRIQRTFNIN